MKNTAWNSFGVSTYFACQWLITIFAVWLFDDFSSIGYLMLAMSITNFIVCIANYNLRTFQVSDSKNEFSNNVYVTSRVFTCMISLVFCWIFVLVAGFSTLQQKVVMAFMVYRACEAFLDVLHGINQKNWRMDINGVSFAARGVASVAGFMLLGWIGGVLWGVVGMLAVIVLVGVMYDYPKTKQHTKLSLCYDIRIVQLLKTCFPLMIVLLVSNFAGAFSRFTVDRIYGTEALGAFSAVVAPTMIVQVAAIFVFAPLVNILTSCLNESKLKEFFKVFTLFGAVIFGFVLLAYVIVLVAGEWGLVFLFGDSIKPYAFLLPSAIVASGIIALMWYMNLVLIIIRDIRGLLYGNIMAAFICLVLVEVFLIEFGLIGANYIMIVCQGIVIVFFSIRAYCFIRRTGKHVKCA